MIMLELLDIRVVKSIVVHYALGTQKTRLIAKQRASYETHFLFAGDAGKPQECSVRLAS